MHDTVIRILCIFALSQSVMRNRAKGDNLISLENNLEARSVNRETVNSTYRENDASIYNVYVQSRLSTKEKR